LKGTDFRSHRDIQITVIAVVKRLSGVFNGTFIDWRTCLVTVQSQYECCWGRDLNV